MLPTHAHAEVFLGTISSLAGCTHLRQLDAPPMICGLHPEAGLLCDDCATVHIGATHAPRPCEVCTRELGAFLVPGKRRVDVSVRLPGGITWPFVGTVQIFGCELCATCAESLLRTL